MQTWIPTLTQVNIFNVGSRWPISRTFNLMLREHPLSQFHISPLLDPCISLQVSLVYFAMLLPLRRATPSYSHPLHIHINLPAPLYFFSRQKNVGKKMKGHPPVASVYLPENFNPSKWHVTRREALSGLKRCLGEALRAGEGGSRKPQSWHHIGL